MFRIRKERDDSRIKRVVAHLEETDQVFEKSMCVDNIRILRSNYQKRFTEFHRIRVKGTLRGRRVEQHYWVRIVKNKRHEEIRESLKKQFRILSHIGRSFEERTDSGFQLEVCHPTLLMLELNALITKECDGILFSIFLRRTIPYLNRKKIEEYCYFIGVWLRNYHECARELVAKTREMDVYLEKFREKYGRSPDPGMRVLTLCHNDYSPRNVFVSRGRIEVIDFVGAETGFAEHDVEFFLNYIHRARFNGLYSNMMKKTMCKAFWQGYREGLDVSGNGRRT